MIEPTAVLCFVQLGVYAVFAGIGSAIEIFKAAASPGSE